MCTVNFVVTYSRLTFFFSIKTYRNLSTHLRVVSIALQVGLLL